METMYLVLLLFNSYLFIFNISLILESSYDCLCIFIIDSGFVQII